MPAKELRQRVRQLEDELELALRIVKDAAEGLAPSMSEARHRWECGIAILAAPLVTRT